MKIPYGMADFLKLREQGLYYVDKTAFIPLLEHPDTTSYPIFLRPRRFGKSLLLSMLGAYYDCALADRFDELFAGLYIHKNKTAEQGKHLVLRLNFSMVACKGDENRVETGFVSAVRQGLRAFLLRYRAEVEGYAQMADLLPRFDSATNMLVETISYPLPEGRKIYVLIDEYDSFANDLISSRRVDLYHDIVEQTGFVRSFFKALKAAAGDLGPVMRILTTGVSPMALDDMASGFNIATQITLDWQFNALCGFTYAEVEQVVDAFLAETPRLGSRDKLLSDLTRSYNGYLFSEDAEERICNPDMVLYYLMHLRKKRHPPQDLLDKNVRTDYGKLRQIALPPSGMEQRHREILETVIIEGGITSTLVDTFGLRRMYEPAHLISLLFYMGLLTIDHYREGLLRLTVPNLVMRRMHWEELTKLLHEQTGVLIDVNRLIEAVSRMAYHGELAPFLNLIQERVLTVLSNRDLMQFDEKHLKMILLSYLSLSPIYRPLSEKEMAQGYSDLILALDSRFPDARYGYLLELKQVRSGASEEEVLAKKAEGEEQLRRYLSDEGLLPSLLKDRELLSAVVVFRGAKEHRVFMQGCSGGAVAA